MRRALLIGVALVAWTLISAFGVGLGYWAADWLFWLLDAASYSFRVWGR
jgi:hypothetical protein